MGKGQDNERALARRLSHWITRGEEEDAVWRSGGSGGMKKKGTVHHGDLISTKPSTVPFFEAFCVETKHLRALDLEGAMRGRKSSPFLGAWRQARREANEAGRQALLIIRPNFQEHLIAWAMDSDTEGPPASFCRVVGRVSGAISKNYDLTTTRIKLDSDLVCICHDLEHFFSETAVFIGERWAYIARSHDANPV